MNYLMRNAKMITERLENLTEIDRSQIEKIIASGKTATIQFSKPVYNKSILTAIDALCREFGDSLEVRFYGHYSGSFDASHLAFIPNVRWLSVDCLMRVTALEHLFALTGLEKLSLGVFELDQADILSRLNIVGMRELFLSETRSCNIDLSPLTQCQRLERLFIKSHNLGFDVLKTLRSLTELSLGSFSKKQSLEVVSDIPDLRKLTIILGGRANIQEVHHPKLTHLDIIRVLGFSDVGDLSRFPSLQSLRIEDQIRLESIDLEKASPELLRLAAFNCKKLSRIGRLAHLTKLEELRIGGTALDYEMLLATPLPSSLQTVAFYTGKPKSNKALRARLDAAGYAEFSARPKLA